MNSSPAPDLKVTPAVGPQLVAVLGLVSEQPVTGTLDEASQQFLKQVASQDVLGYHLVPGLPATRCDANRDPACAKATAR